MHQLFTDFKQAFNSVKREVLYDILLEFGIPKKLVRLIKMCLNKTYSNFHVGKHLSDTFPTQNSLKEDALMPLLFNFASEYAIKKIQENLVGLETNGTYQLVVYADNINLLGDDIIIIKENTETILWASRDVDLEINAEKKKKKKKKYMTISCHQNSGQPEYDS
jgi:hypothetical protein